MNEYHVEDLQTHEKLEERLSSEGWTNLSWHPGHIDREKEVRWKLCGRPPNYSGPYIDYKEVAVKVLADPKDPGKNSGKMLVRDNIN